MTIEVELSRRAFLLGAVAAAGGSSLARAGEVNLREFGAVGDGIADDGVAFQEALRAAVISRKTLYVPTGRYRLSGTPKCGVSGTWSECDIAIRGDGARKSLLVSTPTDTQNGGRVSGPLLLVERPRSVAIEDIGLDGGISEVQHFRADGRTESSFSLFEIRECDKISFTRVLTSRSMHHRSNHDREGASFGRSGPIFLFNCANVHLDSCGSFYPSFREGWWLVNCTDVCIDGFIHEGPSEFDKFATSTPLNVLGPSTRNVTLKNCQITNANGSSVNLGGRGNFVLSHCDFRGNVEPSDYRETNGSARNPGPRGFGKGVDMGSEHQEDFYSNHPPLQSVKIVHCTFISLFSYSIKVTKRKWSSATGLQIAFNRIEQGHRGIDLGNCRDVEIASNRISGIHATPRGPKVFGRSLALSSCDDVEIIENEFTGAQLSVTQTGSPTVQPDVGIYLREATRTTIERNSFYGFRRAQIALGPKSLSLNNEIIIQNNKFRRGRGTHRDFLGVVVPATDMRTIQNKITIGVNQFGSLDGNLFSHRGAPVHILER